jgi:hypothetical protein
MFGQHLLPMRGLPPLASSWQYAPRLTYGALFGRSRQRRGELRRCKAKNDWDRMGMPRSRVRWNDRVPNYQAAVMRVRLDRKDTAISLLALVGMRADGQ